MGESLAGQDAFDMHTHSSVSDGTESPGDVVRAARIAGLVGLALTDHDTTAGWVEASTAARETGLVLIPGMELSAHHEWRSVHMLAYLFNPENSELKDETHRIRESRQARAERIVDRISADYPLKWDDVLAQVTIKTTIGRPHIADALVARGHASDRSAAFAGILHPASGYYEPHYAPTPLRAVQLIRAAGGVPVLAHPGTRGRNGVIGESHLRELVNAGLFGFEIEHRENTPDGRDRLRELAQEFGLVVTGSSDYHGAGKLNRLGEHFSSRSVVAQIVNDATGASPVNW